MFVWSNHCIEVNILSLRWPPTGQDGKLDGNANACLMPYGCESFIHPFCRSCAWPEFGLACIQFTIALYDKVGKVYDERTSERGREEENG